MNNQQNNNSNAQNLGKYTDNHFKNLIDNLFIFMIGGAFIGSLIAQTPGLIIGLVTSAILAINIHLQIIR